MTNSKSEAAWGEVRLPGQVGKLPEFVEAICMNCETVMPFRNNDPGYQELVDWARAHSESTALLETPHSVFVPFKIYERKGK
jgi:hypothetical protein